MLILIFLGLIFTCAIMLTLYQRWSRKKKIKEFLRQVEHEKDIRIFKEALERLNRDLN